MLKNVDLLAPMFQKRWKGLKGPQDLKEASFFTHQTIESLCAKEWVGMVLIWNCFVRSKLRQWDLSLVNFLPYLSLIRCNVCKCERCAKSMINHRKTDFYLILRALSFFISEILNRIQDTAPSLIEWRAKVCWRTEPT